MNTLLRLLKYTGILFLLLIHTANDAFTQTYGIKENWLVGINAGINSFYGDLSIYDTDPIKKLTQESDPGIGVYVGKQLSRVFTLNLGYYSGQMKGSNDAFQMYFTNKFSELSLLAEINISGIIFPNSYSPIDIYAIGGIGSFQSHAIKRQITGDALLEEIHIDFFNTESNSSSLGLKAGIGLKYKLNEKWSANANATYMSSGSDLIDAHIGSTGINDYYSIIGLGFSYSINSKQTYRNYTLPCEVKHNTFKRRNGGVYQACIPFN